MGLPILFARKKKKFNPLSLFAAGEQGVWYDPSDWTTLFQNAAGTTPVTAIEQPVGLILDKSGRGNHASQPTTASRPILRNRYNLLVQTATLSTQNVTTRATSHKLSFSGAGTITLSGTATGTFSAGTNTFTATAGTLTLTVSGTVTEAMLTEANDGNVPYQWVTTGNQSVTNPSVNIVTAGYDTDVTKFPPYLFFDGTDDWMAVPDVAMPINDFVCASGVNVVSNTLSKAIIARAYNWGAFQVIIRANNSATNASKMVVGVGRTGVDQAEAASTANADADNVVSLGSYNRTNVGAATNLAAENNTPYTQTISYNANDAATLGAFRNTANATAGRMNGRLYGVVLRNVATSKIDKTKLVQWMAAKTGVTL